MRIDRLEMLLQYMEQPQEKLAHDEWSFAHFNHGAKEENMCGTCGCMAGGLPAIWPQDWVWRRRLVLRRSHSGAFGTRDVDADLQEWFGLSLEAVNHLFYPNFQRPELLGGKTLDDNSTKDEVVENLRIFIQKAKAGEIS